MQLYDANGVAFKLSIVGYEFPQLADAPYDSNWLIIHVDVTTPERSWRATDPCLLTYEVAQLADWLEQVATSAPAQRSCRFIEPCLQFELHDHEQGERTLRIRFDLEMRPDWPMERIEQRDDIWIDVRVDSRSLLASAQALREQLRRYPQRADR